MTQYLIVLATFIAVFSLGAAILAAAVSKKSPVYARLRKAQGRKAAEASDTGNSPLTSGLVRIGSAVSAGKSSPRLRMELARAGFHNRNAGPIYLGIKMLFLVSGMVGMGSLSSMLGVSMIQALALMLVGASVLFFMPNIFVSMRRDGRRQEIQCHLPDVIDLLEICVTAGMGLDQAWNSVTDEFRDLSPLLADEMALTTLEIHLGGERSTAMRHMAERTGVDDLSSLVSVLVQAERFGTSISDALRVFAESMRELRSQRAEESAEKMSVKMLFPLVVLIFPVVLMVAVAPAGIKLIELLGAP